MVEIFKQNLAIEPDVQNFIQLALSAVAEMGGNSFAASLALLDAARHLRVAGAGTGYPLPVSLVIEELDIVVRCETGHEIALMQLREAPAPARVARISQRLQKSTEVTDPALLLQRNQEMMRYLDETRQRTERELAELQASLQARQQELHETMKQAETDPLTGLFNRRAFDLRLDSAFRRAMRQRDEPLSLLLFDLDFFKEINDQYGHQYGDAYLNKMAQAMLGVIRQDVDAAFRFGGDEFAMLVAADVGTACDKAVRVLDAMTGKVSIGIASINMKTPDAMDLESFVRQADDALYQAKRTGRGRVVCSAERQGDCNGQCSNKVTKASKAAAA
ncbi:MAG: GGDEF domain-containing protein [Betaproteobacteria bacterium]|nr:GGDEF domain-containing protein [Betaproteobacteria bacterium]